MDDKEIQFRQEFYRETGKTPEEEARDSARGLAMLLLIGLGFLCFGLPIYLAVH